MFVKLEVFLRKKFPFQKKAVRSSQRYLLAVIQGLPGIGKSTTVAALACILGESQMDKKVIILAPTNDVAYEVVAGRIMSITEADDVPINVLRVDSVYVRRGKEKGVDGNFLRKNK